MRTRFKTEAKGNSEMCYCLFLYSACKLVFIANILGNTEKLGW